ncbi:amino acid transporter-like protein [Amniculicola lignicola CBS 123094]|uniref:Amino acid transporter-like protein n=1 Tax=Amniculicola lignicola CBS 123094 TaxID=1392246 RepID=A0A6A5WQL5_9PLEO|nr:amino acid transporter-like protein [Amniculicola lignicola CBS 123094]
MSTYEMDDKNGDVPRSRSGAVNEEQGTESNTTSDEAVLARFGKRQQLRRGFRAMSAVGLTCGIMLTWEVLIMTLQFGLENGGPAGLIYGYIVAWIGAGLQALVMAEMASMIPIAGGPFNWVAILAPDYCRKFLSYLTGWLSVLAWQSIVANTCYICGTLIQGLLVLNYPSYHFQRWHGTLLFIAVLTFGLIVNTWLGRLLPRIESLTLLLYVMGFVAVLVTLVYLAPHKSASEVFTTFQNLGGWNSMGLSFFVGFITTMGSFLGIDGADHIAEECQDAQRVVPRAMMWSIGINGAMGFGILLAVLFCMGDPEEAVVSPTGFPFIDIFVYGTGSISGGTGLTAIVLSINIFSVTAVLATASRMLWAFSRENGLPFSNIIARVDTRTRLPLYAIGVTCAINVCLSLINIGSTQAFQAFISLLIASYYSAFLIAAGVMLRKRLTGEDKTLPWGPFRLGKAGIPVTVVAMLYTIIGTFFSFWPFTPEVDAHIMNYSSLLYGAAMIFSVTFYFLRARKTYKGPVYELNE